MVGLQQDEAEAKLRKAGFEVAVEFDDEHAVRAAAPS